MAGPYTPPRLHDIPVPDLFTLIAYQNPQRDFAQIIREHADAPMDSTRISWATFIQHAQNAAADLRLRWAKTVKDEGLKNKAYFPREPGEPPIVAAILAASGYEYYVNMLGCALNRWTVLLISPKNSPAAIEHLLRTSKSSILIVEPSGLTLGRTLENSVSGLSAQEMATLHIPINGFPSSPLTPLTSEQLKTEMDLPAFYMHTSGSTGHPKIIAWSHRFFLSGARVRQRHGDEGIGLPFYCVPPLFHAGGMFSYAMFVVAQGNLILFVSSSAPKPPSAASLLAYAPFIRGGMVCVPPSILEDLHSLGPEAVKIIAEETALIMFAGAPLKKSTGDALVALGLKLTGAYGSTEINIGTKIRAPKDPHNWEYVEFREGYELHFLPVDKQSELRELIVGPGVEDCPAVIDHENPRGHATNDIWEPHPSIPNLWKHHSRKGNVTVLSNGEKSDNKQIESLILQDNRVLYVQVFGAGRPMNGVILQPADPTLPTSEFLLQIQPTIEHANTILPKHSRLVPELTIGALPNKPFATTDKGTVKSKETLDKYEKEIERAYAALEIRTENKFEGSVDNEDDVRIFVRTAVKSVLGGEVPDDGDLFDHGFDSLLSIRLRAAVLSVATNVPNAAQIPRNIIYTSPSINALVAFLVSRAMPGKSEGENTTHEPVVRSIAKFSSDFIVHKPGTKRVQGEVVALSGSTGSLGSSLLILLLERSNVSKVYLLNRKGEGTQKERHARVFKERNLNPNILDENESKITYLDIDLSQQDLGLSSKDYDGLRDNVTHIIHAAWHLNFNLILESYERVHIAGVRHLADLALSSPHHQTPRLTFLSSVAAAGMYRGSSQKPSQGERSGYDLVPEEPIDDPTAPLHQGYGQSKYVGERILVNAVNAGLRATIVRVGQLSGVSTNGAWSLSEHVPILLRSSIALGMIPNDLPPVRWIPSDVAASAVIKQTFGSFAALEYFHIENTSTTPWRDIAEIVSTASPKSLTLVSFAAWLDHVTNSNPDPEKVPAVRLLDFFRGLDQGGGSIAALGWHKSFKVAPELGFGHLTPQLVKKYVLYQVEKSGWA